VAPVVGYRDDHLLTVAATACPESVRELPLDRSSVSFGRSPTCDLVFESGTDRLSAVAGVIWRMDDELWVRNVSTSHDLDVVVPNRPPQPPLPPRLMTQDRGAARSIPSGLAYVLGPDGCSLVVRQELVGGGSPVDDQSGRTLRMPPVPEDLRPVAAALCEPLLDGRNLPASYAQITARAGLGSRKATRIRVERLLQLYAGESDDLSRQMNERRERERARLSAGTPILRQGVWQFGTTTGLAVDEQERRSALALPDYFELAHLLVRRGLVSITDLTMLHDKSGTGADHD
jgi:hypothetical protein